MSFLTNVAAFLVAIAILVTVHEFGHYWVARKLGVKVLKFSIGFGTPLYSKVAGEDKTEYALAAIPLGGYVKMLDEREGDVSPEEQHRAFNVQSVWTRIAIVAAGPIFNFLLAIFLYAVMYMVGVEGVKPKIGNITPVSIAAEAGLKHGDLIVSVDNVEVSSWGVTSLALIDQALDTGRVELLVHTEDGGESRHVLNLSNTKELLDEGNLLKKIGIEPWRPVMEAKFGRLVDDGPAAKAGIKAEDTITAIDGIAVKTWMDVVKYVQEHSNTPLQFSLIRDGQSLDIIATTSEVERDGKVVGLIGALPYIDQAVMADMRVKVTYGPIEAFTQGASKTYDMTVLTLRMMGKLITGQVSAKNISGPISIAEYAGVTATIGVATYLGFLAMLSVSLGVLNLLPVPVLDGGHLLFYFIEVVKGSPLSEEAQGVGQRIGLAMLGTLMVFAFYNDISRLFS